MFGFLCFLNVLILLTTIRIIMPTSSRSVARVALLALAEHVTDFLPLYHPAVVFCRDSFLPFTSGETG